VAPVTLSTQERDAIKGSFDRWSDWIDTFGEPLGFATYVQAWLDCLKAHGRLPAVAQSRYRCRPHAPGRGPSQRRRTGVQESRATTCVGG
jgi:hypothetical protein